MKTPSTCARFFLFGLIVSAGLFQSESHGQGPGTDRDVVTVELKSQAMVDDTVVYLGQIATLVGGPPALRSRLAGMDAAEFRLNAVRTVVSREQIKFRLMLANVHLTRFRFA